MKKKKQVKKLISEITYLANAHDDWAIRDRIKQLDHLISNETMIVNKNDFEVEVEKRYVGYVNVKLITKRYVPIEVQNYCRHCTNGKILDYLHLLKEEMLFDLQEEIEDESN